MRLHEAGRLDEAEELYRRILAANPRHAESLHLLGVIASQRGRHAEAIQQMDAAIEINPNVAAAFNNRGLALAELGRTEEALASFDRAIALSPEYAVAHFGRANALTKLKRLDEALASFDQAIVLKPDYAAAIFNRGNVLSELKRTGEALACFDRAIALKPDYHEAYFNRGNLLAELKQFDEAVASFDRAIALKPDFDPALFNRGSLLKELKRFDEALRSLDAYVALKPNNAKGFNNRGLILSELNRSDEALASYATAIGLDPHYARPFNNRGVVLKDLRRFHDALADFDKAIALEPSYAEAFNNRGTVIKELDGREAALADFEKAIELKPDFHEALNNRGITLHELKRIDEALASYDKAVALKPNYAEGLNNRGICRLLAGRYKEGWADYESRWAIKELRTKRPDINVPNWQGEDLSGCRLVVYSEQGLGDVIQFSRYLPLLARYNATITFSVSSKLNRLLRPVTRDIRMVNTRKVGDDFDFQCALMSLPLRFGTDAETIPNPVPYLKAEDELAARWKTQIGEKGFKIGIAWQGSPKGKIDRGRSILLSEFLPLSRLPGVRLISLQKQHGLEQLAALPADVNIELLGDGFDSGPDAFIDTAAVMANLDLIITSDTSIAHLAGALGRPTWVALKNVPDWRWLLDRTDSPWYPTMRLFRQITDGDWKPVFSRIESELRRLVISRADPGAAQTSFRRGNTLLRQRKFREALESFDRAVANEPRNADAWFNRALTLKDLDRLEEALESLTRVIEISPGHTDAVSTQGIVLAELGRAEEALASFDKVVLLKGRDADALNNRGIVLMKFKRFEEALVTFDRAVELFPDYAQAFNNRGIVLTEMKRLHEALLSFDRAAALDSQSAEICFNRANALAGSDRHDEALAGFDRAIALRPQYPEALFSRGTALLQLKRPAEALVSFDGAIAVRPNYAAAFNNRGNALKDLDRLDSALASFDKAISLNPASAEFFLNRGMVLRQLKRANEALASHDKAIALKPDSAEAIDCRSTTLKEMGRLDEALRELDRAIALNPEFAGGHLNRGIAYLLAGRYDEGWPDYEWRWKTKDLIGKRPGIDTREWKGEDIAGQRIAVYSEQGLGDIIQFSRYLPLLVRRGADVSFFTDVRMHRLLKSLDGRIELHGVRGTSKAVDACCALLSLPARFGTTLSTIPADVPYLRAEKERIARWKARLGDQGFAVGVAWQGNPRSEVDMGRSVALSEFLPLARLPGVRLISLQKQYGLEQLAKLPPGMEVEQLGDDFDNGPDAFIDTAAVMENLDLIVTSDTSIAHLAGALGRPTWVALKKIPDWRWLLEREDSPWYPTLRLFRQSKDGDWKTVFLKMESELRRTLSSKNRSIALRSWPSPRSEVANTGINDTRTYFERGNALIEMNRLDEALASFEHAIALKPDYPAAFNNRGIILLRQKRFNEALESLDKAISLHRDYSQALNNRGIVLTELKRFEEALSNFDKAVTLDPRYVKAFNSRGTALKELGRLEEALENHDRALALDPNCAEAFNSRGTVLNALKRQDEALASYERAIHLKPDFTDAYSNRGIVLKQLKRLDEALASYNKAVASKPDHADSIMDRGLCRLLAGHYKEGWLDYESRWDSSDFPSTRRVIRAQRWQGQKLTSRSLAVYSEQGLGDVVQFARYLPPLVERGAQVTFFVKPKLMRLLKPLTKHIHVSDEINPKEVFDYQCALMSLPLGFDTDESTIPHEVPYLEAEQHLVTRWKQRIGGHGFRIGIAWQGNPQSKIDRGRSVPLAEYLPLARLPGVRLISLQKQHGLEQLAGLPADVRIELLGDDFDNGPDAFIDTAAVMENLDLIVTSDTSIAHLAGALGRPTWVALKKIPDWRWLLDRSDSPWYPTIRLFRQEKDGDWASVFSRIAAELQRLLPRPDVHSQSAKKQPKTSAESTRSLDITRIFESAVASYKAGSYDAAETACRRVLELQADHFGSLHLLGVIARKRGDHTEAVRRIDSALKVDPNVAEAHHHLGSALMELSRHDEAVVSFDRAIALNPKFAQAFNSRGIALQHLKRVDEALLSFEKAISLNPDFAGAHNNRGILLKERKRIDEAVSAYDKAVALKPDFADARTNRGACHLLAGRYEQGWADYDWRFKSAEFSGKGLDIAVPAWRGETLAGRHMAVYGEQGFGDIIQFARYLPMLVQHGAKVTFFVDKALHHLLKSLESQIQLSSTEPSGTFDFQCALMSLPRGFGTTLESVPNEVPYLHADKVRAARWKARLGDRGFRIGIAWQGNPRRPVDRGRSVPLAMFLPLAQLPGVRLISLQKHDGLDQLTQVSAERRLELLGDDFDCGPDAFIDTAAVMESLDLILTADTSIAHLAGALARPTWVALKRVPDWRWLLDREDSPWYPTACLFRQEREGDWSGVFARIEEALSVKLKSQPTAGQRQPPSSSVSGLDTQQLFKEAVALYRSGLLDRAEAMCRQIFESDPTHSRNLHLLGVIAGQRGDKEEAIRHINAALNINPQLSEAHNNLGIAFMELNRLSDALASFDRAIGLRPNYAEALYNRGDVLAAMKMSEEALASYDRAIESKPDYAEAFNNRGNILAEMGRADEALISFNKAIALRPDFAAAFNNRGNVLRELDRLDEALASYEKAIALRPGDAESHKNRGAVLKDLKRLDQALESFDRAIFLKPDLADGFRTRGMCRLLAGRFKEGWSDYEWRQEIVAGKSPLVAAPPWQGEDLSNRSIAITCEQGMGDVIQFARYLPLLVERGAHVTFFADAKLHRLFSTLPQPIRIKNAVAAGEAFDFQCALMSLPLRFDTDGKTIPNQVPYLKAEDDLVARWKARIGDEGFRIGIAWQGNPKGKIDLGRSVHLRAFAPLARLPGVRLISLQKHHGLDQFSELPAATPIEILADDLDSGPDAFIDTAAVMETLDLIITSDTSIAHLAGALGRPTWVVLKHVPDWRWMLDRADSPWYPTMRLFRQITRGDWTAPFNQMEHELQLMVPRSDEASSIATAPVQPARKATVQVSWGELIDKITILKIKEQRLTSPEAIANVRHELAVLEEAEQSIRSIADISGVKDELRSVNEALWDIEDQIRAQEAAQTFNDEFIRLARAVYFHNDKRVSLKRRINVLTNSALMEEKQYTAYQDETAQQRDFKSEPSVETPESNRTLLKNKNVRIGKCRHGLMMYFANDMYIGRSLDLYGEFSESEIALFKQLVQPGMTAVDVGANIGAHTLYLANAVGGRGQVFAFEPQQVLHQMLCGNIALNLHTNVAAIHGALGSSAGTLVLPRIDYSSDGNFGGISLKTEEQGERITVNPLDSYDLQACHFIKIDVEGMETEVLEGAALTIDRFQPLLYVENDRLNTSEHLIKWLMERNYRVYWHTPLLFNPNNFFGQTENVFRRTVSINMLCIPLSKPVKVYGLREVTSPRDTLPAQHRAPRQPPSS